MPAGFGQLPHEDSEQWEPVAATLRAASVYDQHQFAQLFEITAHPMLQLPHAPPGAVSNFLIQLDEQGQTHFLCHTLPFILRSALKVVKLFPEGLARLSAGRSAAVCLTEAQGVSLLANMFLCTIAGDAGSSVGRASLLLHQQLCEGQSPELQAIFDYFDRMRGRLEPGGDDSDEDENDDLVSVEVHGAPRAGLPDVSALFQSVAPLQMCYRLSKDAAFEERSSVWLAEQLSGVELCDGIIDVRPVVSAGEEPTSDKGPEKSVFFVRKTVPALTWEQWISSSLKLRQLHLIKNGGIESRAGALQMDFSLGVQMGNRPDQPGPVPAPEQLLALLLSDRLNPDEALVIAGAEYRDATGESEMPFVTMGGSCVRDSQEAAVDPLDLSIFAEQGPQAQFAQPQLLRELTKLRAGWCALKAPGFESLADSRDVDSGLWGCADVDVDAQFKMLIQWAVSSQCNRRIRLHSIGDPRITELSMLAQKIGEKLGVVGELVQLLGAYVERGWGQTVFEFVENELAND